MRSKSTKVTPSCLLGVLIYTSLPSVTCAHDPGTEFDTSILKNRGLDSSLGVYFSDAAKFTPGRKPVNLRVNGNDKGNVTARFGKQGQLCVDRDFLQSAGLQVPKALNKEVSTDNASSGSKPCYDYLKDYPTAVITPLPGEERVDIVVPEEALSLGEMAPSNYQSGGTAGLLNYDLFTTKSIYEGGGDNYSQATLEEGGNIRDWLLRSRQILTNNNGEYTTESLYTYVQHTFVDQKVILQSGKINISNTMFAGTAINGMQIVPEAALTERGNSGVTVQGIAQGPQARVEVRQAGTLVYSTLVPMGPFTLSNVPITSVNTALEVTVKETNDKESHFIIPAEALHPNKLGGPQGLSIAMGKVRDVDTDDDLPYLLTASNGWTLTSKLNASAGGMIATKYQALGVSLDIAPLPAILISASLKASNDQHDDNKGTDTTLNMSYHTANNISLSASVSKYSSGYRELLDTLQDDFTPYSGQYSANVGWSNNMLGSFSLGYSLNKGVNGNDDSRYVSLAWGRTFSKASVSVSWQSQLNRKEHDKNHTHDDSDMVFVNVSMPIGTQRIGAYMRKQGNSENVGLQTSGNVSRDINYSVSAERDTNNQENSFNGSLNDNLHYTQLGLSAGVEGSNSKNYGATLSGGVLVHSKGVTFTPYRIEDTFGLASLGDKVSNVEISTPSGDVWTDHWGRAVIPSLPAYRNANVEINTESLPKNIDVNNGTTMIVAGHGAVSQINFGVINVRRAMLNVSLPNGKKLAKGSTIVDADGNYVVTVVEDGLVFLNDVEQSPKLYATDDDGKRQCLLHYSLPKERDLDAPYEKVNGVCQ
jgi:outer membrane usher protein FimD/PapC